MGAELKSSALFKIKIMKTHPETVKQFYLVY